jgi:hypothetical protein
MARKYLWIDTPNNSLSPVTMPIDFNPYNNIVHVIGSGGNGGGILATGPGGGGGGGGGAYARKNNLSVAPGATTYFYLPRGNAYSHPTDNDAWFAATTFAASPVGAKGGTRGYPDWYGANQSVRTGGTGGSAAASRGDVKYSGGDGQDGSASNAGGGGGAAGPHGNGLKNATALYGGDGDAGLDGAGGVPGSEHGGDGAYFSITHRWNGSSWTPGSWTLGSGGGAAGKNGINTNGQGGHAGGGGGGSAGSGSLSQYDAGGYPAIIIEYEPLTTANVISDF